MFDLIFPLRAIYFQDCFGKLLFNKLPSKEKEVNRKARPYIELELHTRKIPNCLLFMTSQVIYYKNAMFE